MPPRYAYWTILIDSRPTAFRARDREELLPTLRQLLRTNKDVVLKWFARGKVWDSREAELEARQRPKETKERRERDWRPGGTHQDPRSRFRAGPERRKPSGRRADTPRPERSGRENERRPRRPPRAQGPREILAHRLGKAEPPAESLPAPAPLRDRSETTTGLPKRK